MDTKNNFLTIPVQDGTQMGAYMARPAAKKAPALLILQEAFGVNSHMRAVADRCAQEGFVAIAPELFHRTAPQGFSCPYTEFDKAKGHYQAVTTETLTLDLQATYSYLTQDAQVDAQKIGSLGFCMGGSAAFLANALLPLQGAISFYGGSISSQFLSFTAKQQGPLLLFWGGIDNSITPEQQLSVIQALRREGKLFTNVEFSSADHGFFCDERKSYNDIAAKQAWAHVLAFLHCHFS